MAVNLPSANIQSAGRRIIAFFLKRDDAYRAVSELKDAGFTSDEIGVMARSDHHTDTVSGSIDRDRSFWDKLKDFFSGESSDDVDYGDSASGMNWEERRADYYYRGIGRGGALVSVTGRRIEEARRILQNAGGDLRESGFEDAAPGSPRAGSTRYASAAAVTGAANEGEKLVVPCFGYSRALESNCFSSVIQAALLF
jgi:hypothetical protein